ncbi:molybdenum cofactor biosynthesis protein F [Pokkaliibacter plantistimulans]|uniref:Molybdenum cofactor biosynthesis protein F n=1 Tax=Proteobacteria bacterium 228 TaxID=2083153 RepID=A0A2S5KIF0_9PROT|nr:molybdenum cofactor biosynthesis F family protein [Pokkaliibacter plantistimulans]PPC74532.1 molybdenum cofactor biosynthesis protein F [Pokkaliibacter plantistimulans]
MSTASHPSPEHINTDWITVGALAEGFSADAFILPRLASLAGQHITLHFADGAIIPHRLEQQQLHWHSVNSDTTGTADYRATSLRQDVVLVDFIKHEDGADYSVSLVLDFATASFTAVIGQLPAASTTEAGLYQRALAGKPLTGVEVQFLHGSLDRPWQPGACPHAPTAELIGIRNRYRYSPTEVYEHIYLNEQFYTWQCLKGVEQGLCDTDRCYYYKITADLYLFVWCEKIVPTLGLVMIDMQQHRSDGKIFGYAGGSFEQLANFPVASYCTLINTTEYQDA